MFLHNTERPANKVPTRVALLLAAVYKLHQLHAVTKGTRPTYVCGLPPFEGSFARLRSGSAHRTRVSIAPTFEVVRARPWGAYRCAIVGFGREHTLVREFLHTPSTLCSTVFCSFFDIFSCVHRVLRVISYPIRHVGWVGLPGGPDDRKVARCINVAGERGVYLIASDAESACEKFCF